MSCHESLNKQFPILLEHGLILALQRRQERQQIHFESDSFGVSTKSGATIGQRES
jgi:hypothetical protein